MFLEVKSFPLTYYYNDIGNLLSQILMNVIMEKITVMLMPPVTIYVVATAVIVMKDFLVMVHFV